MDFGLHDNSVSSPLRNCRTIFHSSYIILHSHQQCLRSLVSTHPHQKAGVVDFVLSCCCSVTELCWTLTAPPGQNTGLLQGIFLTQGSNPRPMSLASPPLADRFFTVAPPGWPSVSVLMVPCCCFDLHFSGG